MKSQVTSTRAGSHGRLSAMDGLLRRSPLFWGALFALAQPWFRLEWIGWTLYPAQLALTLWAFWALLADKALLYPLKGLYPLLLLGGYLTLMNGIRGEWSGAAIIAGSFLAAYVWGAGAYVAGHGRKGQQTLPPGMVIYLGLVLATGLVFWGLRASAPHWFQAMPSMDSSISGGNVAGDAMEMAQFAACRYFPCGIEGQWPFPFQGGWLNHAQYALLLVFLLPTVGALLLGWRQVPRQPGLPWPLLALVVLATLGLMAGAAWWQWALLLAGMAICTLILGPGRFWLMQRMAAGLALGALLFYAALPAYLPFLGGEQQRGAQRESARVDLIAPGQTTQTARTALRTQSVQATQLPLSSLRETLVTVRLTNTGWVPLAGGRGQPDDSLGQPPEIATRVSAQVLYTDDKGSTSRHEVGGASLAEPLNPGKSREFSITIRLPHWLKAGYLGWRVEKGGETVTLEADSHPGFRLRNPDYRPLEQDAENRFSIWTQRARRFMQTARATDSTAPPGNGWFVVLGDMVDTLFFSPLWGEQAGDGLQPAPFSAPRPVLFQLFHKYGFIGLGLVVYFWLRLKRRAAHLAALKNAAGDPLALELTLLTLWLIMAASWVTPELGSYHGLWALFLLGGWIEGRYERAVPPAMRNRKAPRSSTRSSTTSWPKPRRKGLFSRFRRRKSAYWYNQ